MSSARIGPTLPARPGARRGCAPKYTAQGSLLRVIDLKALRDNPDLARASQEARGADPALVDALLEADRRRREALQGFETLRAEQKTASQIGRASCRGRAGNPPDG